MNACEHFADAAGMTCVIWMKPHSLKQGRKAPLSLDYTSVITWHLRQVGRWQTAHRWACGSCLPHCVHGIDWNMIPTRCQPHISQLMWIVWRRIAFTLFSVVDNGVSLWGRPKKQPRNRWFPTKQDQHRQLQQQSCLAGACWCASWNEGTDRKSVRILVKGGSHMGESIDRRQRTPLHVLNVQFFSLWRSPKWMWTVCQDCRASSLFFVMVASLLLI